MVHSGFGGIFPNFDASPPFFSFFLVFISAWVGVFIVYSAGMVCISFLYNDGCFLRYFFFLSRVSRSLCPEFHVSYDQMNFCVLENRGVSLFCFD